MKVLVTGANGFLGRHVVEALARAGHSVRALVRPAASTSQLGWGDKIEVVRHGRVRRAKLYYLRELRGKAARIEERRQV